MGTCVPAGVIPLANTLFIVSSSPLLSLYLSLKFRGYIPEYLSRRLYCCGGDVVGIIYDAVSSLCISGVAEKKVMSS